MLFLLRKIPTCSHPTVHSQLWDMGFLRRLFGPRRTSSSSSSSTQPSKDKRRWSFLKNRSHNTTSSSTPPAKVDSSNSDTPAGALDANKHAIAVAAATAAVAEAALAAAHAAAEVVRLTSGTGPGSSVSAAQASRNRQLAAVKIQSAFRAYLVCFVFLKFPSFFSSFKFRFRCFGWNGPSF